MKYPSALRLGGWKVKVAELEGGKAREEVSQPAGRELRDGLLQLPTEILELWCWKSTAVLCVEPTFCCCFLRKQLFAKRRRSRVCTPSLNAHAPAPRHPLLPTMMVAVTLPPGTFASNPLLQSACSPATSSCGPLSSWRHRRSRSPMPCERCCSSAPGVVMRIASCRMARVVRDCLRQVRRQPARHHGARDSLRAAGATARDSR